MHESEQTKKHRGAKFEEAVLASGHVAARQRC